MKVLPPGTILQLMYLKSRLKKIKSGTFIEIGPGEGLITQMLIDLGWNGTIYEFDPESADRLSKKFDWAIKRKMLNIRCENFLDTDINQNESTCDLLISCMVLEHFNDEDEKKFLDVAKHLLRPNGKLVALLPASPKDWGVEDEIAGHYRRYSREYIREILSFNWYIDDISGLTFPLSNILLPLSNYLVRKNELEKNINLTYEDRTKNSGRRKVLFKTTFPPLFSLLLNSITMLPFYILQNFFSSSKRALVLYIETRKK